MLGSNPREMDGNAVLDTVRTPEVLESHLGMVITANVRFPPVSATPDPLRTLARPDIVRSRLNDWRANGLGRETKKAAHRGARNICAQLEQLEGAAVDPYDGGIALGPGCLTLAKSTPNCNASCTKSTRCWKVMVRTRMSREVAGLGDLPKAEKRRWVRFSRRDDYASRGTGIATRSERLKRA